MPQEIPGATKPKPRVSGLDEEKLRGVVQQRMAQMGTRPPPASGSRQHSDAGAGDPQPFLNMLTGSAGYSAQEIESVGNVQARIWQDPAEHGRRLVSNYSALPPALQRRYAPEFQDQIKKVNETLEHKAMLRKPSDPFGGGLLTGWFGAGVKKIAKGAGLGDLSQKVTFEQFDPSTGELVPIDAGEVPQSDLVMRAAAAVQYAEQFGGGAIPVDPGIKDAVKLYMNAGALSSGFQMLGEFAVLKKVSGAAAARIGGTGTIPRLAKGFLEAAGGTGKAGAVKHAAALGFEHGAISGAVENIRTYEDQLKEQFKAADFNDLEEYGYNWDDYLEAKSSNLLGRTWDLLKSSGKAGAIGAGEFLVFTALAGGAGAGRRALAFGPASAKAEVALLKANGSAFKELRPAILRSLDSSAASSAFKSRALKAVGSGIDFMAAGTGMEIIHEALIPSGDDSRWAELLGADPWVHFAIGAVAGFGPPWRATADRAKREGWSGKKTYDQLLGEAPRHLRPMMEQLKQQGWSEEHIGVSWRDMSSNPKKWASTVGRILKEKLTPKDWIKLKQEMALEAAKRRGLGADIKSFEDLIGPKDPKESDEEYQKRGNDALKARMTEGWNEYTEKVLGTRERERALPPAQTAGGELDYLRATQAPREGEVPVQTPEPYKSPYRTKAEKIVDRRERMAALAEREGVGRLTPEEIERRAGPMDEGLERMLTQVEEVLQGRRSSGAGAVQQMVTEARRIGTPQTEVEADRLGQIRAQLDRFMRDPQVRGPVVRQEAEAELKARAIQDLREDQAELERKYLEDRIEYDDLQKMEMIEKALEEARTDEGWKIPQGYPRRGGRGGEAKVLPFDEGPAEGPSPQPAPRGPAPPKGAGPAKELPPAEPRFSPEDAAKPPKGPSAAEKEAAAREELAAKATRKPQEAPKAEEAPEPVPAPEEGKMTPEEATAEIADLAAKDKAEAKAKEEAKVYGKANWDAMIEKAPVDKNAARVLRNALESKILPSYKRLDAARALAEASANPQFVFALPKEAKRLLTAAEKPPAPTPKESTYREPPKPEDATRAPTAAVPEATKVPRAAPPKAEPEPSAEPTRADYEYARPLLKRLQEIGDAWGKAWQASERKGLESGVPDLMAAAAKYGEEARSAIGDASGAMRQAFLKTKGWEQFKPYVDMKGGPYNRAFEEIRKIFDEIQGGGGKTMEVEAEREKAAGSASTELLKLATKSVTPKRLTKDVKVLKQEFGEEAVAEAMADLLAQGEFTGNQKSWVNGYLQRYNAKKNS